ncbi:MAG: hypothetical protein EXS16_12925 [Gemmataceae bacterium]|nr:hypothetical protein [Gemmataceae bacterium]
MTAMNRNVMRIRNLIFVGVSLLLVVLVVSLSSQTHARVRMGMTENEVAEILGGDCLLLTFRTDQELKDFAAALRMPAPPGATVRRWDRNDQSIHVVFDGEGRVAGVYYPIGARRLINTVLCSFGLN